VSENRVRRRIFGHKSEKMTIGWRILHTKELHKLYVSQNIIRVIKSMRISCAEHAARMGQIKMYTKLRSENPKGRDHSEDIGRTICKWILGKQGGKLCTGCI
jgi:hypothetical protein